MAYSKRNPNGQATSANSAPVVLASDQSAVPVSGTFYQATQPVSAASLPLPTGAATAANQSTANGSLATLAGAVSGTEMQVDVISMPTTAVTGTVSISGTVPVSGTFWQATQPVSMATNTPVGNVAHDASDSGAPIKIGYKVETSPKGITLAADGDRTDAYGDADGIQLVKLNTSNADIISERVTDTGGTSTAFTNFGAVASTKNYVTAITVYNSSATPGYVDFRSGTGGTVLWTMPLPAGSGAVIGNASPLFATSAGTALAYDVSAALSTVYISVSGFQSKA